MPRRAPEQATGSRAKLPAKQRVVSRPQSVRFDPVVERRVQAAAAHEGVSISEFIREAVQERTERVLGSASLWDRICPIVESIPATGEPSDAASSTHSAFGELAAKQHAEKIPRWPLNPEV